MMSRRMRRRGRKMGVGAEEDSWSRMLGEEVSLLE